MYYFYYDSGTTNTRAYLIRNNQIVQQGERSVGSRNCALMNDNTILKNALQQLYQELLAKEKISDCDVKDIYLSGMISSPSGLIEIEHLSTPLNFSMLKKHAVSFSMEEFGGRSVWIIPGIKTLPPGKKVTACEVANANNMRGEEIEIFGILHRHPELEKGHCCIVLPGSHTQVAFLQDGSIINISSNVTGELYHAIIKETILSSSVAGSEKTDILPEMVSMGYEALHKFGFNRALYMVRSMELFSDSTLAQRRSYLEGVVNSGVMDAISQAMPVPCVIAVAGPHIHYQIFSAITASHFPQFKIVEIPASSSLPYSVEGFLKFIET